jgi:glycosyltransferase involved in cell wall biosynthesis
MLGFAWRLAPVMKNEAARFGPPSAIIVSSPHPFPIWPAAAFAGRTGARLVFEVRDIWPLSLKETLGTRTWHPFYLLLAVIERYAYRRADAVVSLLSAAREHMTAHGLAPEKFNVIPNGAPDTPESAGPIDPAVEQWLERCRAEGRRVVGYAGSFGTPYAMISFLDICDRMAAVPDVQGKLAFLFVGDGVERQPLQEGLEARHAEGRAPKFFFAGQVTREAAARLMTGCDAGMILSKDTPLFRHGIAMNKLVEYMRLGKPILAAYEAGGDPIAEARCGWRVTPESPDSFVDVLTAFAGAPAAELAAMGARGREYFIDSYGYRRIARRYLEVLRLAQGA